MFCFVYAPFDHQPMLVELSCTVQTARAQCSQDNMYSTVNDVYDYDADAYMGVGDNATEVISRTVARALLALAARIKDNPPLWDGVNISEYLALSYDFEDEDIATIMRQDVQDLFANWPRL